MIEKTFKDIYEKLKLKEGMTENKLFYIQSGRNLQITGPNAKLSEVHISIDGVRICETQVDPIWEISKIVFE